MTMTLIAVGAVLCVLIAVWINRRRSRLDRDRCITPEALHTLLTSNEDVLVVDVRQPLDLLAKAEMIPGAKRIPPKEVLKNPSLIPEERETVVYCTCPSEKTSRSVLRKAKGRRFSRLKFLQGGLEAWKAKGYPVEPYNETFHLDTRT